MNSPAGIIRWHAISHFLCWILYQKTRVAFWLCWRFNKESARTQQQTTRHLTWSMSSEGKFTAFHRSIKISILEFFKEWDHQKCHNHHWQPMFVCKIEDDFDIHPTFIKQIDTFFCFDSKRAPSTFQYFAKILPCNLLFCALKVQLWIFLSSSPTLPYFLLFMLVSQIKPRALKANLDDTISTPISTTVKIQKKIS